MVARSRHEQTTKKDARFNTDKLNPDAFSLMIHNGYSEMKRIGTGHRTAQNIASTGMRVILRACEASMLRKKPPVKRRAVYWWTEEIAELRRIATRCLRKASRAKKNGTDIILRCAKYKVAKKALQWAINQSKKEKIKCLI